MANTKKTGTESTKTAKPKSNKVTRNYMRPREEKSKFIKGSLNGKDFKVPYNETVELDPEVAAIIDWSLATQDFADEYIQRVEQNPEDQ